MPMMDYARYLALDETCPLLDALWGWLSKSVLGKSPLHLLPIKLAQGSGHLSILTGGLAFSRLCFRSTLLRGSFACGSLV